MTPSPPRSTSCAGVSPPPLQVGFGIEVDYQPALIEETLEYLDRHAFDVVLLSVHWIGGQPSRWWSHRDAEAMQSEYFATMRSAAELCRELAATGRRPFDIISHFDYVKRYLRRYRGVAMGPIEPAVLDPILEALIAADVVPEINTAGMRRDEVEAYASPSILERYRELGGSSVSIGSDAHHSPRHRRRVRRCSPSSCRTSASKARRYSGTERSASYRGECPWNPWALVRFGGRSKARRNAFE